jgi:hypothetical protein
VPEKTRVSWTGVSFLRPLSLQKASILYSEGTGRHLFEGFRNCCVTIGDFPEFSVREKNSLYAGKKELRHKRVDGWVGVGGESETVSL